MTKRFYITTAIDFVNATPHIGHAYEKICADVIARAMRLRDYSVIFQMGTDEHSTNVARKAAEAGIEPLAFCDEMVEKFLAVWEKLNLSYDVFIRTTSERHSNTVRDLLRRVHENGDIYQGKYKGYYCQSCERFYQEKDLVGKADGFYCRVHEIECEWLEEDNYFFRLSRYRDALLAHIEANPSFILPDNRRNEIVNVLKEGLEDVSISRSGITWGVRLPWDEEAVTYVWFDALINYVSAIGYSDDRTTYNHFWPAQLQVIGKDISRFHCIYWPAMLMSAGLPLPESIFAHGFVTYGGQKLSKTSGHVVEPLEIVDRFGADALRYFLVRDVPWGRDGDFTYERFVERYNADLANNLGNLVSRSLTMILKYAGGVIKLPEHPAGDRNNVFDVGLLERYLESFEAWRLHDMAATTIEMVDGVNLYIDRVKPWVLAKNAEAATRLQVVLYNLAEALRWIAVCAFPFIPEGAAKIWKQLNLPGKVADARFRDLRWGGFPCGVAVGETRPIFPRIEK